MKVKGKEGGWEGRDERWEGVRGGDEEEGREGRRDRRRPGRERV